MVLRIKNGCTSVLAHSIRKKLDVAICVLAGPLGQAAYLLTWNGRNFNGEKMYIIVHFIGLAIFEILKDRYKNIFDLKDTSFESITLKCIKGSFLTSRTRLSNNGTILFEGDFLPPIPNPCRMHYPCGAKTLQSYLVPNIT